MSKIIKYKEENYDFPTFLLMLKDKNFKSLINTDEYVNLTDTGESIQITNLTEEWNSRNFAVRDATKHLSQAQRNKITKAINEDNLQINKAELWQKFNDDVITVEELEQLMLLENKNLNIHYVKGFYVNKTKDKPEILSDDYYGKFFRLLHLMNYGNTLRHDNARPIKKKDIYTFLGMKTERAFEIFIKALMKFNMIAKIKKEINNKPINYLIINPAYATMNILIDNTIFELFKEDIKELLSPLEIKYLEMKKQESANSMMAYED
jgi:hypothetical protein